MNSLCWFLLLTSKWARKRKSSKGIVGCGEAHICFLFCFLKRWWKMYCVDSTLQLLVQPEATWLIYLTIYGKTTEPCMMSIKPELNFIWDVCLFWMPTLMLHSMSKAPHVTMNQPQNWTAALDSLKFTPLVACLINYFQIQLQECSAANICWNYVFFNMVIHISKIHHMRMFPPFFSVLYTPNF